MRLEEYKKQRSDAARLAENMRFGRLIIKNFDHEERGYAKSGNPWREVYWLCQCDCGQEKVIRQSQLKYGGTNSTKSCGCLAKDGLRRTAQKLKEERVDYFIGKKYNCLTIDSFAYTDEKSRTWVNCHCICGTIKTIKLTLVRTGRTKSCGCWIKSEQYSTKIRLSEGVAAFNQLYKKYKSLAKTRGLSFELTELQAEILFSMPCHYCGIAPQQTEKSLVSKFSYNGIDRQDNSLGYVWKNCVPCCHKCNFAKYTMTITEFRDWIVRLHNHLIGQELK